MNRRHRKSIVFVGFIAALVFANSVACIGQARQKASFTNWPVDHTTAVSFFYFGDIWSHWRKPMNFYVVAAGDPKLHRVDIGHDLKSKGNETWITASEMQAILHSLPQSDLEWTESKRVEVFRDWKERPAENWFEITIVSSRGTAKTRIRLTRMCEELQTLDAAMPTKRILWQFQTLRWDHGCVVPGYHNELKPED
jgi:hypothetical protein